MAVHVKRDSGTCEVLFESARQYDSSSHITVNVNPVVCVKKTEKEIEEEFNAIAKDM